MACIKPPAQLTAPSAPAGPTRVLSEPVREPDPLIDPLQFEPRLDKGGRLVGLHHVTPDQLVMHVRNPEAQQYDAREVAVDLKTGTVRADLHIKGPDGEDYSKGGPHTFTNPALSRIQAQADLVSAWNDPNATWTDANTLVGVSTSGTTYQIAVKDGAIHGWPLAPNLAPPSH